MAKKKARSAAKGGARKKPLEGAKAALQRFLARFTGGMPAISPASLLSMVAGALGVALLAVFSWLSWNADATISDRVQRTPRVTIALTGPMPTLPVSSTVLGQETDSSGSPIAENPAGGDGTPDEKAAGLASDPSAAKGTAKTGNAGVSGIGAANAAEPVDDPHGYPVDIQVSGDALPRAPDLELIEDTKQGPLPIIADDGRTPWKVYARPFSPTGPRRPRLAIVIAGLGLSQAATEAAIQYMPPAVTLAFSPYADDLSHWIDRARAAGHEVLLSLAMEPTRFPLSDPGPQGLVRPIPGSRVVKRLKWQLSRFTGYVGVTNDMGGAFGADEEALTPILNELSQRGLLMVDAKRTSSSLIAVVASEVGMPRVVNNRFLDTVAARKPIDRALEDLARTARSEGYAVGFGQAFPVTLERLAVWLPTLDGQNIHLAPVSAIADRQKM